MGSAPLLSAQQPRLDEAPIIDIHSHYYPGDYFDKIRNTSTSEYSFDTDEAGTTIIKFRGARFFGIQPPMSDPSLRLEEMDRLGVDLQVCSLSVPNVFFGEESMEPEIARLVNDGYAELIARHPKRFGGFASLPMNHPDETLKELDRAINELRLNGVILLSNIRGKSLTDPQFRPFFEEANRMELAIIMHPMMPASSGDQFKEYVLGPIVGFMFDTTLAIARMTFDGLFRDFPKIRWIIPHLGGAVPFLMGRFDRGHHDFVACRKKIDEPPSEYLKNLYYGTVSATTHTVELVRNVMGTDHIAMGSDFPHLLGSLEGAVNTVRSLRIPGAEKNRIFNGTARSILNNLD